jgi:hypothetical protein
MIRHRVETAGQLGGNEPSSSTKSREFLDWQILSSWINAVPLGLKLCS